MQQVDIQTQISASNNQEYEQFLIARYNNWSVYLHANQCYLGRMVIWSHREEYADIFMLDRKELEELTVICRQLKHALDGLFKPDLYNWASYANVLHHQHVHLVPRYKRPVKWRGMTFIDDRWGMNHAPADKITTLSEDAREKLLSLIRHRLVG